MRANRATRCALVGVAVVLLGCGGERQGRNAPAGASQDPEAAVLAEAKSAQRYTVTVSGPPVLAARSEAQYQLRIRPQGRFRISEDYPHRLEVEAPLGLQLSKPSQGVGDATRLDAGGCDFALGVTPERAGSHQVRARLRFGICEADLLCEPVTRVVTFDLRAE